MGNGRDGNGGSREKFAGLNGHSGSTKSVHGQTYSSAAVGRGLTRGISMVEQTVIDMNTKLPNGSPKKRPSLTGNSIGEQRTLHQVARDGDVIAMRNMLEALGPLARHHVNHLNEDRLSPLHYAARYNHYEMVKLVVEHGAIVHVRGEDGLTPLHFAARYKSSKYHRSVSDTHTPIEIEEESDDDTGDDDVFGKTENDISNNMKNDNSDTKQTKTYQTINWKVKSIGSPFQKLRGLKSSRNLSSEEFVQEMTTSPPSPTETEDSFKDNFGENVILYLVSQMAEVNAKDDYGLTPLHYAAMRSNDNAAKTLLSCDAINVEARDAEDMTPLHLAAIHNNPSIARLLIDYGAQLRCRDEHMATPLHRAATEGNLEIVKMLLEAFEEREDWSSAPLMIADVDHDQSTALHLAVESGHLNVVSYLISKGADVNIPRQNYVYPLHLAATTGDVEIVKIILPSNERIDCLNGNGETPLHRAAEFNHAAVIDILISNGADIERKDRNDFTPLLMSANHGHVEAIECLLRHNANLHATDKDDKTAVYWAVQQNKPNAVMSLLKDPRSHSLISRTDRYGNSLLHIATLKGYVFITQCLLDIGAPIELKNEMEQTPLHLAAWHGRTKIVKDLIKHSKTAINSEDEEGNTPLHMAALAGHDNVIKALLEVGANIEARNSHLWTPLDCAASRGFINSVRILLDAGCPIDPQEKNKTTPLHLAAASGSVDVVVLLLENGADITRRDDQNRNCLEIAIDHTKKDVARAIVQSDYWLAALRCENYDERGMKQTPLRMLIRKMPDVAEDVFDRCSHSNNLPHEHPLYTVSFNYELVDDTYITFEKHESEASSHGSISEDSNIKPITNNNLSQYSYYGKVVKENHPLMIMVRSRRQKLLSHPLCISLLHLKWVSFGRYVYYTNLLFYLLFLAFLTGYILTTPAPQVDEKVQNDVTEHEPSETDDTTPSQTQPSENYANCPYPVDIDFVLEESIFSELGKYVIVALATFHLMKEVFQFYMIRLSYFTFENLMEWSCYITALLLVIDFSECSFQTGLREPWQWQIGAIAIFLAWINLVLFISKFPYLGLYVVMFFDVLTTFCKVCVVFFFFIIAFAFGFHTVLYYQEPFNSAAKSIVRTMVMMLGEFQFDDIFDQDSLRYPAPSYILFVIFLVLICLITMNLLVGLAVDDIKSVQAQANLKRLAMQVELVLNVESILPKMLQERFVIRERSFMTNRRRQTFFRKIFAKINNTQALSEALGCPEKTEMERILEQQEALLNRIANTEMVAASLQNENQKLQNLIITLMRHQGVRWEEEDKF